MVRRQIQITDVKDGLPMHGGSADSSACTPEIVRIRTTACTSLEERESESHREDLVLLRRHGHVESSCDVSQDLRTVSGAQTLTTTNSTNLEHNTKKLEQMPNRQVSLENIWILSSV